MNRFLSLILALVLVFALCACGEKAEEAGSEANTQIANPMVELTPQELEEALGLALLPPDGASDTMYYLIDGTVGEVQFKYGTNGEEYSYRAQKTDAFQDISGVYFTSAAIVDAELDPLPPATICLDESEGFGAVTWYADGYSYSIYMGEGATDNALISIYQLISPVQ